MHLASILKLFLIEFEGCWIDSIMGWMENIEWNFENYFLIQCTTERFDVKRSSLSFCTNNNHTLKEPLISWLSALALISTKHYRLNRKRGETWTVRQKSVNSRKI